MADGFVPLALQACSRRALQTHRTEEADTHGFTFPGLFGAIGSLLCLCERMKKQRDPTALHIYLRQHRRGRVPIDAEHRSVVVGALP